jgi:hypothetical protein
VGTAVHDTASLTGETANAGGTITYNVYTNSACTNLFQSATPGTSTVVNGVVPDSSTITFTTAGTYYWGAAYTGDANNAADSNPCSAEVLTVSATTPPPGGGFPTLEQLLDPAFWLQQLHDLLVLLGIDPGVIGLGNADLSSLTPPATTADAPADAPAGTQDAPTSPADEPCLGPELTQARRLVRTAGAYDLNADARALARELQAKLEHYNNSLGCG